MPRVRRIRTVAAERCHGGDIGASDRQTGQVPSSASRQLVCLARRRHRRRSGLTGLQDRVTGLAFRLFVPEQVGGGHRDIRYGDDSPWRSRLTEPESGPAHRAASRP